MRFLRASFFLLIGILGVTATYAQSAFTPTNAPGTYARDLSLGFDLSPNWTLAYRFSQDSDYLPYSSPLNLSALDGETHVFRIALKAHGPDGQDLEQALTYRVDKTAPVIPEPELAPMTYFAPQTLVFDTASTDADSHVVYSYTASDGTAQSSTEGSSLSLTGTGGQSVSYHVSASAVDEAGNQSGTGLWDYTIDRRRERQIPDIPVYSPVEGRFQNPQYLYIDASAFKTLKFSTDGSDPKSAGQNYAGGVLLSANGKVQLKIYGLTLDGRELQKTVNYEAGTEQLSQLESGILSSTKTIQVDTDTFYYTASERAPSAFDDVLSHPLRVSPQTGTLRGLALRLLRASDQAQFRYYLVLDGRIPQAPEVWIRAYDTLRDRFATLGAGAVVPGPLKVEARGSEGTRVYYRTDGKDPSEAAGSGTDFPVTLPEASLRAVAGNGGSLILSFQARQGQGAWGPALRVPLKIAPKPSPPSLSPSMSADGIAISRSQPSPLILYTLDSPFNTDSDRGPFVLPPGSPVDSLPYGAFGSFGYTFYAQSEAGLVSDAFKPGPLKVSFLPPQSPKISSDDAAKITIDGSAPIFYRISSDNTAAPSITQDFLPYNGPVQLKGLPDANVNYSVEAYSSDSSGRRSSSARKDGIAIISKVPAAADLIDHEKLIYRNLRSFALNIDKPEQGVRYYFSLSPAGTAAQDPKPGQSPFTYDSIPVSADREQVNIELRILPVSDLNPSLVGPVSSFTINVDTLPPPLPTLVGVKDGAAYNGPVSITLAGGTPQEFLYYRLSGLSGDGDWIPYSQAIVIDAPPSSSSTYRLDLMARDRAGNSNQSSRSVIFTITTLIPVLQPPKFQNQEGQNLPGTMVVSRGDIRLSWDIPADQSVVYVLAPSPTQVGTQSPVVSPGGNEVKLHAEPGAEQTWSLVYHVADRAGNMSPDSPTYTITVDKIIPAPPPPPHVARRGNAGELFWTGDQSKSIVYAIVTDPAQADPKSFQAYLGGNISWSIPDSLAAVSVLYKSLDAAGNESPVQTLTIDKKLVAPKPSIAELSQGGLYNSEVTIHSPDPIKGGQIRYELSTGSDSANPVSEQSALLPPSLDIGPISGESLSYHLAVRQFADGYEASDEADYDFIIDRSPPLPPSAKGFDSLNYLSDGVKASLQSEDGATTYFFLYSQSLDFGAEEVPLDANAVGALAQTAQFSVYSAPISLEADPKSVMRYVLIAYTVDKAGNRSSGNAVWQAFVDSQSIYVNDPATLGPADSKGLETGTRAEPFLDLGRALDYAKKNGKSNVVLAQGKYQLSSVQTLGTDLEISGGYDSRTWRIVDDGQSIVYPKQGFSDSSLFSLSTGHFDFKRLYLIDAGQALKNMIRLDSGSLSISDSTIAASSSANALDGNKASLSVSGTSFSFNDPVGGTLIHLSQSDASFASTVIESADLPLVLLKDAIKASYTLVSAESSSLNFDGTKILPRRGASTLGIMLRSSSMKASNSELHSGSGSVSAAAVDAAADSSLSLSGSRVSGDAGSRNAVLVRMDSSKATVDNGSIELAAAEGVFGFLIKGGSLDLNGTRVVAQSARDFITVLSAEQAKVSVTSTTVSGASTKDFQLGLMRGGTGLWKANTVTISGVQSSLGIGVFSFFGDAENDIEDNTFSSDDQSTLFYVGSPESKLTVRQNVFEHWRFILQEASANLVRQSDSQKGITSIEELERLERAGSIFEGNKVRQGL